MTMKNGMLVFARNVTKLTIKKENKMDEFLSFIEREFVDDVGDVYSKNEITTKNLEKLNILLRKAIKDKKSKTKIKKLKIKMNICFEYVADNSIYCKKIPDIIKRDTLSAMEDPTEFIRGHLSLTENLNVLVKIEKIDN